MALGTPYVTDAAGFQQDTGPTPGGEQICNETADALTALNVNTKTPTANFTIKYNKCVMCFTKGIPFVADSGLLTALNAAYNNSPPIV